MPCCTSDHDFFTLAEVQEFLCENCGSLLPSASLFAEQKIRYKSWHREVPEPEEIVHIVFEKYWSGTRKMRKTIFPQTQVFLAIASVLSNLATHSKNRRMTSLFTPYAGQDHISGGQSPEFEDRQTLAPDDDLSSREECMHLLDLLRGNDLDHRVLEFILSRPETTSREFRHAVRPRVIANELCVSRHEVYRSLERMRRVFDSLPSKSKAQRDCPSKPRRDDSVPESNRHRSHDRSRIPSGPKFMTRQKKIRQACDDHRETT